MAVRGGGSSEEKVKTSWGTGWEGGKLYGAGAQGLGMVLIVFLVYCPWLFLSPALSEGVVGPVGSPGYSHYSS